jgi:hypothetical protein
MTTTHFLSPGGLGEKIRKFTAATLKIAYSFIIESSTSLHIFPYVHDMHAHTHISCMMTLMYKQMCALAQMYTVHRTAILMII